jgi:hypothetical protein
LSCHSLALRMRVRGGGMWLLNKSRWFGRSCWFVGVE